ncbi:MAG: hypothetical protein AAFW68_07635, partial [Pseudomonadota bacterium]
MLTKEQASSAEAALRLSGVFSARAYVNGVEIGSKGEPGMSAASETPGMVDMVLNLGEGKIVGENDLLLFVSTHHANYRPGNLIHEIAIKPFGDAPKRSIGRYGLALASAGLISALMIVFACGSIVQRGDKALTCASLATGLLLIAFGAESLRAFFNYTYPYHWIRMAGVFFALSGFGIFLLLAVLHHFGVKRMRLLIFVMLIGL